MKKTLYENLGVDKDASPQEIKSAYRKRAKEKHPDKGGNKEEFLTLQKSYSLLNDPKRRAAYDKTGTEEEVKNVREQAVKRLAEMAVNFIEQIPGSDTVDLIKLMREVIGKSYRKMEDEKEAVGKRITRLNKAALKFNVKGQGDNFLRRAVENQAACLANSKKAIDQEIELLQEMNAVLDGFTYKVEPAPKYPAWDAPIHGSGEIKFSEGFKSMFGL